MRAGVLTCIALLLATVAAQPSGDDTSIRPFKFHASDAALADLKRRVAATRWPERETVEDASQGVNLATMKKLADYWAKHYDWRKAEKQLDSYPQFVTNIDGLDIHFIRVKSKDPNALPVIITHGWPGSVMEQLKIIDPLTNPPRTAARPRTRSTSSSRRFPATASPASRPAPAGTRSTSRAPGPC